MLAPVRASHRRLSIALLWLAIALVPLRGWATAWMISTVGTDAPAAVAEAADTPPCHGAMHDAVEASANEATSPSHTCSMCDLCHTQVAQAPAMPSLPAAPHEAPPLASADDPVEPRAPDALYRPPRPSRA